MRQYREREMKKILRLKKKSRNDLPEEFRGEDIRFPESLVEYFVRLFTREGDVVFDPFAGFGTTLSVAEKMGRAGYGIESDRRRAEYIRSILTEPGNLIEGDSRKLADYDIPLFDLAITSPPYPFTGKKSVPNPLSPPDSKEGGYEAYISELSFIFAELGKLMKPESHVVVEVGNLRLLGEIVTLAWDIARALSEVLTFEDEITVNWDRGDFGFDHTYCLIFSK